MDYSIRIRSIKLIHVQGDTVIFAATCDCLPSHTTNKDNRATDAVSPVLGLISVACSV